MTGAPRRTVLIIDDHAAFRRAARATLEAGGFDVVGEAGNGEDGLAAAADLRPDVVLLDVVLPDHDGFVVCDRLTSASDTPSVVMRSSRDPGAYRLGLARSAARGFIHKRELSGAALAAVLG